MSENSNGYLSEVHPVAKEKKVLKLMEQTHSQIGFGFDVTFDELAEYDRLTYTSGVSEVEDNQIIDKVCKKYRILLTAKRRYNGAGEWYLDGNLEGYELWFMGLSDAGGIISRKYFRRNEVDFFHFFGLEFWDEVIKIHPFVLNTFRYGDYAVIPKMGDSKYVNAKVVMSELSYEGKQVIKAVRRQSDCLKSLLSPKNGVMKVNIWEAGHHSITPDVFAVKVVSELNVRERCRRYGMDGLKKSELVYGNEYNYEYGLPIPSKEDMDKLEKEWGDLTTKYADRTYFVPRKLADSYLQGKLTGAEAINYFSENVLLSCERGHWKLV